MDPKLAITYTIDSYTDISDLIVESANEFYKTFDIYPNVLFASQNTFDRMTEDDFLKDAEKCEDITDDEIAEYEKKIAMLPYRFPKFKNFPELANYGYVAYDFAVSYFINENVKNDEFQLAWDETVLEGR